jgi:hypothetical protein
MSRPCRPPTPDRFPRHRALGPGHVSRVTARRPSWADAIFDSISTLANDAKPRPRPESFHTDTATRPDGSSEIWRVKICICCANGHVSLYGTYVVLALSEVPLQRLCFGPSGWQKPRTSTKAPTINYILNCNSVGSNDDVAHLFCTAIASYTKSWLATTRDDRQGVDLSRGIVQEKKKGNQEELTRSII